ncbi:hypothetical protein E4U56_001977 [Claviceps arundinis]|uniref:Uncharacterized protein n=1 Tax=Claviceps arundinis TaxID=1623583 RepID=A0A9P7N0I2_9HYPO|nr:hypothetical protein E4U56_001977 [Claviceps arundinis]
MRSDVPSDCCHRDRKNTGMAVAIDIEILANSASRSCWLDETDGVLPSDPVAVVDAGRPDR